MFIKKWVDCDFKYETKNTANKPMLVLVNLKEGIISKHLKNEDGNWDTICPHREAIRIHEGELEVWDARPEIQAWSAVNNKLREAFVGYVADKELLKEEQDGDNNGD